MCDVMSTQAQVHTTKGKKMFPKDAVVYFADSTYIEYKTNKDCKPHLGSSKQREICFNIHFYFNFNTWYFLNE